MHVDLVDPEPIDSSLPVRRFYGVSGWLISAVCHLTALLMMLLVALPAGSQLMRPLVVSMGSGADAPEPQFTLAAEEITVEADNASAAVEVQDALSYLKDAEAIEVVDPRVTGTGLETANLAPLDSRVGGDRGKAGDAMFFGTSASGRDFVFILDCSGSMIARQGERFARARDELVDSVSRLRPDQRFYVFLFNWSTTPMFGPDGDPGGLVDVTGANVAKLRSWLYSIRPESGTDPRLALIKSLEMNPDAVFLLSDGQFNTPSHGNRLPGWDVGEPSVFAVVARANTQQVQINTVAFEDVVAAKGMSRLAEEADGQFRFVPAPGQDQIAFDGDADPDAPPRRVPLVDPQQSREERVRLAQAILLIRRAERLVQRNDHENARALVQELKEEELPPEARRRLEDIRR